MSRFVKIAASIAVVFAFASCATYYQKNFEMMDAVYKANYQGANAILDNGKLKTQKRNRLLYYLNKGSILFMSNQHEESNKYFQQADFFIEDFQKNYLTKAATFVSNPGIENYEGENYEKVLIHYFTTLNYLKQGKLDEALVECKRMELKLQKITDYYKGKNKYRTDALVYLLSGIVYDAQKEYNAAFIAYRNAYDVYKTEYQNNLNTPIPHQLKLDLIRTALLTGFTEEARQYKEEFKMDFFALDSNVKNNAVIFWNNGFGPVKDEWSVNFTITPAGNGWVNFVNWDLGLNIPYYAGSDEQAMADLNIIRIAFPKYVSRIPTITQASIKIDSLGINAPLYEAENIDKIAYVSLKDRFLLEVTEAVGRFAVKQLAAAVAKKEDKSLGAAISVLNAVTEKADTRNWQLLPYSINYTRIQAPPGDYNAKFSSDNGELTFQLPIKKGSTYFQIIQSPYFNGYSEPLHNGF